jgi:2-keto-4-pentenoate hydratase/2-oxohepta-3-ene-1,7-dioic acid hydratase in catechol pathway
MNRRQVLTGIAAGLAASTAHAQSKATRYCRFKKGNVVAYGIVEGDTVRQIRGDLFAEHKETSTKHKLSEVKLLYPVAAPSKILALAGNYKSHLGKSAAHTHPEPFLKPPSCLQNPDDPIIIPTGATNVHHECELVIVIGKKATRVTEQQAKDYIFGVTAGNDVSERIWQNDPKVKDIQWWRAKGADTFGPLGPFIARGIDYGNLKIACRVNGQTKQDEHTSHMVHNCDQIVSFISETVTLYPGDLIFTGTGGTTTAMKAGDTVEVELEGVGILRNKLVNV